MPRAFSSSAEAMIIFLDFMLQYEYDSEIRIRMVIYSQTSFSKFSNRKSEEKEEEWLAENYLFRVEGDEFESFPWHGGVPT